MACQVSLDDHMIGHLRQESQMNQNAASRSCLLWLLAEQDLATCDLRPCLWPVSQLPWSRHWSPLASWAMVSAAKTWTIHRFLSNNVVMRQLTSPIRDYFCGDSVIIQISKQNGSNIIPTTPASALSSLVLLSPTGPVSGLMLACVGCRAETSLACHWTGNNK